MMLLSRNYFVNTKRMFVDDSVRVRNNLGTFVLTKNDLVKTNVMQGGPDIQQNNTLDTSLIKYFT